MKSLLLAAWALLPALSFAGSTDEILLTVQRAIEQEESLNEVEESLSELSIAEGKELSAQLEMAWAKLERNYLANFGRYTQQLFKGSARNDNQRRVRELRKEFHRIRLLSEDAMKPLVKEVSMPALKELKTLLLPSTDEILEFAPAELKKEHQLVHGIAEFRDLLQEYSVSQGEDDTPGSLRKAEAEILSKYQDLDRAGLRIMENNDEIAAKANLPEAERRGIRELNEWRLLLDQSALEIDPKLCDAGRGHSQDMAEKGFFDHTSPIPGKRTPSDRAKAAGTSGSGENIYMGSTEPEAANRGWFYSPGHHKNMFRPNYKLVGLGQFNRHWTQMFH